VKNQHIYFFGSIQNQACGYTLALKKKNNDWYCSMFHVQNWHDEET